MDERFTHLEAYIRDSFIEVSDFTAYEASFVSYMNSLDWQGSWINWPVYKHVDIRFANSNYWEHFCETTEEDFDKIVYVIPSLKHDSFEATVFICDVEFGIKNLDEVLWRCPPHQYGYLTKRGEDLLQARPNNFFETDIQNSLRIRIR